MVQSEEETVWLVTYHFVFIWTAGKWVNNGDYIVTQPDKLQSVFDAFRQGLLCTHWKACANAREHAFLQTDNYLRLWLDPWSVLKVCALCHFVLIWRTFPRTTEFESSSSVWSGVCDPTGSRAQAQSLLCMHWVHQFVYSNSQLFCLTAQANAIDESSGEFIVMSQLQGCGNEEAGFAQVGTTRQSNAAVAWLSQFFQDWIETAKVSI